MVQFDKKTKKREAKARESLENTSNRRDKGTESLASDKARVEEMKASGAPVRCIERLEKLIEKRSGKTREMKFGGFDVCPYCHKPVTEGWHRHVKECRERFDKINDDMEECDDKQEVE